MGQQEKQRKFITWRDSLEQRWANRLCDSNPKDEPRIEPPLDLVGVNRLKDAGVKPKLRVEVLESPSLVGAWEVFVNGRLVCCYSGPYAHERASKKASDVANDIA